VEKDQQGTHPGYRIDGGEALGVNVIVLDPLNPGVVYAGTTKGLFRTSNRGEAWERIGLVLPDPFVSSIVIHPIQSSQLYIGGPGGVWRSTDNGQTFQAVNSGLATLNIRALVMSPRNPQKLYAGTNGSGLYHSTNGGEAWTPMPLKAAVPEVRQPRTL
jgi:ligand-binding sensor domain-containing protein